MIFFTSPSSYTGEDMLEIQCHGAISIINKMLLELSLFENCRFASPGEFSKRAFMNNKKGLLHLKDLRILLPLKQKVKDWLRLNRLLENQRIFAEFGEIPY